MLHLALTSMIALAPTPDPVVARVGSDVIRADAVRERAGVTKAAPEVVVQQLVDEALLADAGYQAGVDRDANVRARVDAELRRLAAARLVERGLWPAARLGDDELLAMYHAATDAADLELVVLATEADARAALERLDRGAKLADEARASLDPESRAAGGALGWRRRGDMKPGVAELAFTTPVGRFVGPVKLEVGFAVLRVRDRQVGDEAGFAAKREELRRFSETQAREKVKKHYLAQLRSAANVKVDEAFLRSTAGRLDGSPEEMSHVVAQVGDHSVRYADVAAEITRVFGAASGHASGPTVKAEMAWSLVDARLLEDAAVKAGLAKDPEVRARLNRFEREAVGRAYLERLQAGVPPPSEREVERWYDAHRGAYRVPARHHCSHIVVASEKQARQLRDRIVASETFEQVARGYSLDGATNGQGGLIGDVGDDRLDELATKDAEPDLARALRDARPGETSAPVRSRMGWHLVRCSAVTPAQVQSVGEVHDRIAAELTAARREQAVKDQVARLRARVEVAVDRDALAAAARKH